MFSPCYFHLIISIGILESNLLSLSTPSRTKWTLVYLLMLYSTIKTIQETLLQSIQSLYIYTEIADNSNGSQYQQELIIVGRGSIQC